MITRAGIRSRVRTAGSLLAVLVLAGCDSLGYAYYNRLPYPVICTRNDEQRTLTLPARKYWPPAMADHYPDRVEFRDQQGRLIGSFTREELRRAHVRGGPVLVIDKNGVTVSTDTGRADLQ